MCERELAIRRTDADPCLLFYWPPAALEYGAELVWGPEIVDKAIIGSTRVVDGESCPPSTSLRSVRTRMKTRCS